MSDGYPIGAHVWVWAHIRKKWMPAEIRGPAARMILTDSLGRKSEHYAQAVSDIGQPFIDKYIPLSWVRPYSDPNTPPDPL